MNEASTDDISDTHYLQGFNLAHHFTDLSWPPTNHLDSSHGSRGAGRSSHPSRIDKGHSGGAKLDAEPRPCLPPPSLLPAALSFSVRYLKVLDSDVHVEANKKEGVYKTRNYQIPLNRIVGTPGPKMLMSAR